MAWRDGWTEGDKNIRPIGLTGVASVGNGFLRLWTEKEREEER